MADFFNEPVVPENDLPGYTGDAGGKIHTQADDDFEVAGVGVRFLDINGAVLEQGFAARNGNGGSEWEYLATTTLSAGQSVPIELTTTDQPGHKTTTASLRTL